MFLLSNTGGEFQRIFKEFVLCPSIKKHIFWVQYEIQALIDVIIASIPGGVRTS